MKTITSIEIAEECSKKHNNVLRDIRLLMGSLGVDHEVYRSHRMSLQNKKIPIYCLPENLAKIAIDRYKGLSRIPMSIQEKAALSAIEQILGITLERQFRVGKYRIDGYHRASNTAYEIDESHHRFTAERDGERQREINDVLGCKFVRIEL